MIGVGIMLTELRKRGENNMEDSEQIWEMVTIPCPCGRTEHYADAKYCGNCGRKLERAAGDGPLQETHL